MQQTNTATLLKHRDSNPLIMPMDKTIRIQDNRKAYFQRKKQANKKLITIN